MQVSTAEFRKGLKIELDGQPYNIVEFQHVKPGKGGAFVRTKLKHLRLGRVVDRTFRAGEKVGLVDYEQRSMQYLYKDDNFHFMNLQTFEQIALDADVVGEAASWLKETMEVDVLIINGVPAGVEVPNFVELEVVKTDPGLRGDTASGGSKPATLETGAVVQVPALHQRGGGPPDRHPHRGLHRAGLRGAVNQREIRRLADLLRDYGLTEVEVEREGVRVRLRREPAALAGAFRPGPPSPRRPSASPAVSAASAASEAHLLTIEAPMVGTFYRAPSPDAQPFVRDGDRVKKGQVVCIIEAMKLMNEIESKVAGRVVKVLVENTQPVEYGQPLFLLEP